eukprot:1156229-Pelagomonas_calceolata.AAC.2
MNKTGQVIGGLQHALYLAPATPTLNVTAGSHLPPPRSTNNSMFADTRSADIALTTGSSVKNH